MPGGKFDLPGSLAREWLDLPNPSGVDNIDVLKPYVGGDDITDKNKDRWTVDFNQISFEEAEKYRRPMKYVIENVKSVREESRAKGKRDKWWLYERARPEMRAALKTLPRFIGTSEVSKHRIFVRLPTTALPSRTISVIAADDDLTFGVLNSSLHTLWALRTGTALEDRPRYTPTTCFETFPFPRSTAEQAEAISQAARYLEQTRAYLKSKRDPSKKADAGSSDQDKTLTLTGMYNLLAEYRVTGKTTVEAITTLADAHDTLDQAVAAAYGWDWPLAEDEVLSRLLALNLERAAPV